MKTNRLSPHLLKHMQWNVWLHGTVIRPVTAESIRSRQTGHVGNSYVDPTCSACDLVVAKARESSVSIFTLDTLTTWHVSGSMLLNGFPLYASANSAASARLGKFTTTIERLGRESRIMRRCSIDSAAGATKARKSEGVIHDGTARTASMTPSVESGVSSTISGMDVDVDASVEADAPTNMEALVTTVDSR